MKKYNNPLVFILSVLLTGLISGALITNAVAAPKVFVCKYVGQPGINETLQTGQNPISVSLNAIPAGVGVGGSFADQHGRSLVIAFDTGQDEPECPVPENPQTPPQTPPATPPTTPPTTVTEEDNPTPTTGKGI